MASYTCDTCGKEYRHKRNLIRHIREKHQENQHWACIVTGCSSQFIRQSYFYRHLEIVHGYSKNTARRCALAATRVRERVNLDYYEDVNTNDDDFFDILAELDNADVSDAENVIQNFDSEHFENAYVNEHGVCDSEVTGSISDPEITIDAEEPDDVPPNECKSDVSDTFDREEQFDVLFNEITIEAEEPDDVPPGHDSDANEVTSDPEGTDVDQQSDVSMRNNEDSVLAVEGLYEDISDYDVHDIVSDSVVGECADVDVD